MAFGHRELRTNATAFTNVRSQGKPIRSPQHAGTGLETRPTRPAIRSRRVGLQPIDEAPTQRLSLGLTLSALLQSDTRTDQRGQPVIVLRPVHQADRGEGLRILETGRIADATIRPQVGKRPFPHRIEGQASRLEGDGMGMFPGKQSTRPRWRHLGYIIPPSDVIVRALNPMILACMVF